MVHPWLAAPVPTRAVTIGSLWAPLIGDCPVDAVVAWPPDVFALVNQVLDASEAYRFIVSPPQGAELTPMGTSAATAAREWCEWLDLDGDRRVPPDSVLNRWVCIRDAMDVEIDDLSAGKQWHVIEALLALHAIADEACAGLVSSTAAAPGPGTVFRAAAREHSRERGVITSRLDDRPPHPVPLPRRRGEPNRHRVLRGHLIGTEAESPAGTPRLERSTSRRSSSDPAAKRWCGPSMTLRMVQAPSHLTRA